MIYRNYLKRIIDILIVLTALVILFPLFLLVVILIKLDSKGPIFFMQERVGKNENLFLIYKFRSMTDKKRSSDQQIFDGDMEITRVGGILRRSKIDELPQILNIIKGDMSIVGPRPGLKKQLKAMSNLEKKRYSIRPGLTGIAQVSGNIHNSWQQRYVYDLEYINNISVLNDLKIIFRTVILVFIGEEKFIDKPLKLEK